MFVSIIIPIYNVEDYLSRCLDSCLQQIFSDFEIIAVDDCGSDSSMAIVKSYSDVRIKVVHHDINRGLSAARNTGLKHASGKYILFLDSDDYIAPNLLKLCVNEAEQKQVDFVSFNSVKVDEKGEQFANFWMQKYAGQDLHNITIHHPAACTLAGWDVAAWAKLVRRDFLLAHQINFDEQQTWFEDHLFSAQLFCLGRFSYLDHVLHYYFQRSTDSAQKSITQEKGLKVALYRAKAIEGVSSWLISSGNHAQFVHFLPLFLEQYKIILTEAEADKKTFIEIYNILRKAFSPFEDSYLQIKPLLIVDMVYILRYFSAQEFLFSIGSVSKVSCKHLTLAVTGAHCDELATYVNMQLQLPALTHKFKLLPYLPAFLLSNGVAHLLPKQFALKLRDFYVLSKTDLFDYRSYVKIAERRFYSRNHAICHYLNIGEKQNFSPNLFFYPQGYLSHNPDLKTINMSLFVHYILYANLEGRQC